MTTDTTTQQLDALAVHIAQRSGIDYRNYGERAAYMSDYRPMLAAGADARVLLRYVRTMALGWHDRLLPEAGRNAFSGRLTYDATNARWDYCTGQYFVTEYRAAACSVLVTAIAAHWRDGTPDMSHTDVMKRARATFGRRVAAWFR